MSWHFYPYTLPYLLSAAIFVLLGFFLWLRRRRRGMQVYFLLLLGLSLWSLGYGQELAGLDFSQSNVWSMMKFGGKVIVPGALFAFTLIFSGRQKYLSFWVISALIIEPIAALIGEASLLYFNSKNILSSFYVLVPFSLESSILIRWDLLHKAYTYALLAISILLLIQCIFGFRRPFRNQAVTLLIGGILPWMGEIYTGNFLPYAFPDFTPAAFVVSAAAMTLAILRYRMLDLKPFTPENVIASMEDGFVVLDSKHRVIDLNPTAATILDKRYHQLIGKGIEQVFPPWNEVIKTSDRGSFAPVSLDPKDTDRTINVHVSSLKNGNYGSRGHVIVLQNIPLKQEIGGLSEDFESRYRMLFESADEAMILSDLYGKVIECNACVSKLFDYSKEELKGMALSKIIGTQSVLSNSDAITRMRKNGFTIFEGIGKGKFGRQFPVEIKTRVLSIADEQFIFTQTQDMTSCRRLEKALQESIDKTHAFYEISQSLLIFEPLPDMLQAVADGISNALKADRVTILILDENQQQILHFIRGGENSDQISFASLEELRQGLTGWVLSEKKPALSPKGRPDRRESLKAQKRRAEAHSGAILVVPIISKEQVIGTISAVNRPDQDNFTQQDTDLIMAISNQIAISIENAALFKEAERQIHEIETLRNTGTAVTATLQQDETIERILEQLANVVPYDSASVQLLGDGYLEIVGGRGWADPRSVIGIRFAIPGENPNTHVIQERNPYILGDASRNHASFLKEPHSHINSWLGVPLLVDNQVIGMLALDSTQPNFYSEQHAGQASAFANQVAIALKNARLYSSERQRVRELNALRATMADISAELELTRLLESILQRAALLLNATGGELGLYDEEHEEIVVAVSHNMGEDFTGTRMALGEGAMGKVAEIIQPILIDDYPNWAGKSAQYESGPWHAVIAVPLMIGGHIIGALGIVDSNPRRKFTLSDQRLLNLFGQQAAIAIQNARLFEAEQSQFREAETLRRAGAAVAATLDHNEAIEKILEQLKVVVPYDSASVQLLRKGYLEVVGGRGWSDSSAVVGRRYSIPEDNPNTLVIQRKESINVRDTKVDYPHFHRSFSNDHTRSWLGTPLIIHDKIIGMLAVHKKEPNFYKRKHARLITAFADHVAVAIENARLYSTEKQRASELDGLNSATAMLLTTIDLETLLKQILSSAIQAIHKAEKGILLLADQQTGNLKVKAVQGYTNPRAESLVISNEGRFDDKPMCDAGPVLISDVKLNAQIQYSGEFLDAQEIRSAIVAPMVLNDKVLGVISLGSIYPDDFKQTDLNLLVSFAATATAAIRNAQLHGEVQKMAITDSLTGMYNRRGIFELGQMELDRAMRFRRPLSAIMLDIDYFKQINDTYSHAIGDQVLKELSVRCQRHLREVDILGRYGGEEFAILLPETDEKKACLVAERLRETMTDNPIPTDRGPVSITISLGVATASKGAQNLAILLDRADTAMYVAKQAGRNQVALE